MNRIKTYTCLVGISTYVAVLVVLGYIVHCRSIEYQLSFLSLFYFFYFCQIGSAMQETTQFIMDLISITRNHNAIRNLCLCETNDERHSEGDTERLGESETDAGVLL